MVNESKNPESRPRHVCPWWIGYILCCPLRRFLENPDTILAPHVRTGMKVVEPGCGMGFFSLPLARMVGREGRVICVDLQQRMIAGLSKRAKKAGLADRIETVVCTADNLGLGPWQGTIDLVTAIHMIHEIPDQMPFFAQAHNALRASGRLLILEPKGHVTADAFDKTLELARKAGFTELEPPRLKREHTALLQKC